jgi:hypothetical protein
VVPEPGSGFGDPSQKVSRMKPLPHRLSFSKDHKRQDLYLPQELQDAIEETAQASLQEQGRHSRLLA